MNTRKHPPVTVILPVYNGEKFLKKTLESMSAMDYPNYTILISDNASTDNTGLICSAFAEKDSRVRYSRNETNVGPGKNAQKLEQMCLTPYIMVASDHDLWHPSYISRLMEVLTKDESVVLAYPRTTIIDIHDNIIEKAPDILDTRGLDRIRRFSKIIWEFTWGNMNFGIFRTDAYRHSIKTERNVIGCDHVQMALLSLEGSIAQVDDFLFYRRDNRPGEDNIKRQIDWYMKSKIKALTPWTMLAFEQIKVVREADLSETEKELLLEDIINCYRSRFGNGIRKEALDLAENSQRIFSNQEIPPSLRVHMALELLETAGICRFFSPETSELESVETFATGLVSSLQPIGSQVTALYKSETIAEKVDSRKTASPLTPDSAPDQTGVKKTDETRYETAWSLPPGKIKLYAGDIPEIPQYNGWIGLSLNGQNQRHIHHDITHPFPIPDNSVDSFQAEDVFEHIAYDTLVPILNEIHRVLKPGGLFRLSVPDYRCDILFERSIKDDRGNIIFDPMGGGTPEAPGHVWFPLYENIKAAIEASAFGSSGRIDFLHYYREDGTQVTNPIDYAIAHVQRTPDFDSRVQNPYRPMSIVVDLVKAAQFQKIHTAAATAVQRPTPSDDQVRFSFIMIVLNGMPFVEYALKAIYQEAHEIIVIEGAVQKCMFAANPDGSSVDGTVECIRNFPDPQGKILLKQGQWPEKCEMQNEALAHVSGNYVWLVDSDEIYRSDDIRKIRAILNSDPSITQINFIPDNFWKGFDFLFVAPYFFQTPAHYRRLFKFVSGARFTSHRPPTLFWPDSDRSTEQMKLVDGTTTRKLGIYPYHYSYVLESQVLQKMELYRRYGWEQGWKVNLESWYKDFYTRWTPDNRHELEKKFPIWTGSANSYSLPFNGPHPEMMEELIAEFNKSARIFKYDVYFDLNDGCNLEYVMCGGKKKANQQHVMKIEDFSRNMLPLLRRANHYQFGCLYEPLLVPYFANAALQLPEPEACGPHGRIVTNGTLLNDGNIQAILDKGIFKRILISIDGATPEIFEKIRRGAKFASLISNIKALVSHARNINSTVSIELLFTILRENYHQLPEIVKLAKELELRKVLTHKHAPNDISFIDDEFYENVTTIISDAKELAQKLGIEFVDPGYVSASDYEAGKAKESTGKRRCALSLNSRIDFNINCKGIITTPCRRVGTPLGNILHATLDEIITGNSYKKVIDCIDNPDEQVCQSCYLFQEAPTVLASEARKPFKPFSPDAPAMVNVINAIHELKSEFAGILAVETGTIRSYNEKHESTRHISETLGSKGHLISVDCNPESLRISRDICRNASNVTWVESLSITFLETSGHMRFHFALLDSANDKDLIFEEFRLVVPLMHENGIVMINDAGITVDGGSIDTNVAAQKGHKVWEFLVRNSVPFDVLPLPCGHGTQLAFRITGESARKLKVTLNGCQELSATANYPSNMCKKPHVKIAGEVASTNDLTEVNSESEFARAVKELFTAIRPKRIIETGTYLGEGTTRVIAESMLELGLNDTIFCSIECNPKNFRLALENLSKRSLLSRVNVMHGLSVPRNMLPDIREIEEKCVNNIEFDDIFVDHQEQQRTLLYYKETDFAGIEDDMLGRALDMFRDSPDFVLLDSGGHMGNIEFTYVISRIKSPCYIALDDIFHIKHHKSFKQMQNDERFEIMTVSEEKFGFCLAKFTPGRQPVHEDTERLIWLRTDSIGDTILSASMLPHIREHYSDASITVVCQEHIAEFYEACPYVDDILPFNRRRALSDAGYLDSLLSRLKDIRADLLLNSVYSRDPLTDFLALGCKARRTVALEGDLSNMTSEARDRNNRIYSQVIASPGDWKGELERHRDFLAGIGITAPNLAPVAWVTPEDTAWADELFKSKALDPEKTIVLFAGAQYAVRLYEGYGNALKHVCQDHDFAIIALGREEDGPINLRNLEHAGARCVNLCGQTTIRQSAAIIGRCRLAVGAETGLAHLACAMNTPNAILLGGGHFGRFMPYSRLTAIACLPLNCYGCNWKCRYSRSHCVADLEPHVLEQAILSALSGEQKECHVITETEREWTHEPALPSWRDCSGYLQPEVAEIQSAWPTVSHSPTEKNASEFQYLVSAIVSTYRSERFIRGCLEDLVHQSLFTAGNLEIIVIDSGSPENEQTVVQEYQDKFPNNIIYIRTPDRETIYQAWNRGIHAASGRYITNANTDDRHRPDALEVMAKALDENPDIALVYADQIITTIPNQTFEQCTPAGYFNWPEFNRTQLIHCSCIGPQPMWRKDLHTALGLFDGSLKVAGDYDWWLRLSKHHRFLHIPELLGLYYLNRNGMEYSNQPQCRDETEMIQRKAAEESGVTPDFNRYRTSFLTTSHPSAARSAATAGNPMVSVIVPTCNRPEMLKTALHSILNQTYDNYEIIVINDYGENVATLLEETGRADKIVYINKERKVERSAARNAGLLSSRGKYIAYLDDDDAFYPDHLETLVNLLENSDFKVAYSNAIRAVQQKEGNAYRTISKDRPYSCSFDKNRILVDNFIPILCMMHEKNCLDGIGLFDESLTTHEDWDLWIRMSRKFDFYHIAKSTCEFTYREDGNSTTGGKLPLFLKSYKMIYEKYRNLASSIPGVTKEQEINLFHAYLRAYDFLGKRTESLLSESKSVPELTKYLIQELSLTGATEPQILSTIYWQSGLRAESPNSAVKCFETALQYDNNNHHAKLDAIRAYLMLGDNKKAEKELETLMQICPNDASLRKILSDIRQTFNQ